MVLRDRLRAAIVMSVRVEFYASPQQQKNQGTPMAAERQQNLQDKFLNHVRKEKTALTIFLINGVKLQGIVTWFDNFCVLLRRDGHSQLVYKHAISTIMPATPVHLMDNDVGDEK
jgi:host factor-I protein